MTYFKVIFMEVFYGIFIWVWFLVFVEFVLEFTFVTFWYIFYFINFECGGMLASHSTWKNLVYLTHFSWVFHELFAGVLLSFGYHFNSLLLTKDYWSLLWEFLLSCLTVCGDQLFDFRCNSTDWLPRDVICIYINFLGC